MVGTGAMRFLTAASLCFLALAAFGQPPDGRVTGKIFDQNGKPVVGAAVSVKDLATGETRVAKSAKSGSYAFLDLKPTLYSVGVEARGFRKYLHPKIAIWPGQVVREDVRLVPGEWMSAPVE